tara:strand:- start:551 stop:925 length:375 start_codon:yes stop_codon:yes gene_type:complete
MKITRTRKERINGVETIEDYTLRNKDYILIIPNSENEEGIFGSFNSQKKNNNKKIELYHPAYRLGHLDIEGTSIPNITINANYNITTENSEKVYVGLEDIVNVLRSWKNRENEVEMVRELILQK